MATKHRRLADLYASGRDVSFNDEDGGEPITVYLRKMSTIDSETASRRASAAKARVLIDSRNKESEEYVAAYGEVADLTRDMLIDIVTADELSEINQSVTAQKAEDEEWSKDGYLQGLQDLWNDELREVYESGNEDDDRLDEARRVFGELKRFDDEVAKTVDAERKRLRLDMERTPDHVLHEKAVERNFALRADMAWLKEFRRCQIWMCVRDPDNRSQRYFAQRSDVDELAALLINRLYDELDKLNVTPQEGKDLPPTLSSSPSLEQQNEGETAASSGLSVVNQ